MKRKQLRIAIIAPPSLPIPPFHGYGGTQRGIFDFIEELNNTKHKVYLFAPGDSRARNLENIILISNLEKSLWAPYNSRSIKKKEKKEKEYRSFCIKHSLLDEVDIINVRYDNKEVIEGICERGLTSKIVYSLHNIPDREKKSAIKENNIVSVAHCSEHKKTYGNEKIRTIVYGINVDAYPFTREPLKKAKNNLFEIQQLIKNRKKEYLLLLSAISKYKGQKTAIEISRIVNIPIIIAGTPQVRKTKKHLKYFLEYVKPSIDGELVFYYGNADEEEKKKLMGHAKAFIFPSGYEDKSWKEPFGRVVVESLATGTPVVAYNKGGPKDIIAHGKTGFLFNNFEEAVRYTKEVDSIKREACRNHAKQKFSKQRVAKEYIDLFYELMNQKN